MINKLNIFRFILSAVLITAVAGGTAYASTRFSKPPAPLEVAVEQAAPPAAQEQAAQLAAPLAQVGKVLEGQANPVSSDQSKANTALDQADASPAQYSGNLQISGIAGTNFQQSLQAAVNQRKAQGLPVPGEISFEFDVVDQAGNDSSQDYSTNGKDVNLLITGKTVVAFMHPAQAGYDKWPDLAVEAGDLNGADGFVKPGNYDKVVKDWLAAQIPGVWDQYEFGFEPRQYIIEETYSVNYSEAKLNELILALSDVSNATSVEEILLGFTYEGPAINYTIAETFDVLGVTIAEFGAQFKLDWSLGLRLPLEVTLDSPDPVDEGAPFNPTTSIKGLDWSADDFTSAGAPAEGGNEFVMRFNFLVGGSIKILGEEILGAAFEYNMDKSSSFITPFGPVASFPIPPLNIPIWKLDLALATFSLGFDFVPEIGSDKITADWSASQGATGSGMVTYTAPASPVSFGSLTPPNGPDTVALELENYRYWFSKFLIEIGAYFNVDFVAFDPIKIDIPITDFDLSFISSGLYVNKHAGTSDLVMLSVAVQDMPAVVTAGSDQTANEGDLVSLDPAATFTDPGVNDVHNATIDWGDGTPVSDGTLVEAGGSGTVTGSHVYADNGVYTVLISVCEDTSCGSDSLVITVENVAPTVSAISAPGEKMVGTEVSASASFTDPGTLDTHSAVWDWGDGFFGPGVVDQGAGSGTVTGSYMYTTCDLYSIVLTVTDDDGGVGTSPAHSILILSPKDGVARLIDYLKGLGLDHGIENSLLSKLENAWDKMESGKSNPAENMLGAFVNELEAQSGKKVDESAAAYMIGYAQDIIAASAAGYCTGP